MKNEDMSLEEIDNFILEFEKVLVALNAFIDEDISKGGQGSGCHGDNCGRPNSNNVKPTGNSSGTSTPELPRSGVRPSAVNPARREIAYREERPANPRPRSGVRPGKPK